MNPDILLPSDVARSVEVGVLLIITVGDNIAGAVDSQLF
jgi:hypothetical protein